MKPLVNESRSIHVITEYVIKKNNVKSAFETSIGYVFGTLECTTRTDVIFGVEVEKKLLLFIPDYTGIRLLERLYFDFSKALEVEESGWAKLNFSDGYYGSPEYKLLSVDEKDFEQ